MKDSAELTATTIRANAQTSANERTKLEAIYDRQSEINRYILRLCSVVYGPISRNSLLTCLNRALPKDTNPFTAAKLKTSLDLLVAQNLLMVDSNMGPKCVPALVELATREAIVRREFELFVAAIQQTMPVRTGYRGGRQFTNRNEFIREVRIGLYRGDKGFVAKQLEDYNDYSYDRSFNFAELLATIFNNPFEPEWLNNLAPELAEMTLNSIFSDSVFNLTPVSEVLAWLQESYSNKVDAAKQSVPDNRQNTFRRRLLTNQLLMRGQLKEVHLRIAHLENPALSAMGWLKFLEGDDAQAILYFEQSLATAKPKAGKRPALFDNLQGLIFILALIRTGTPEAWQQAEAYAGQIAKQNGHWLQSSGRRLESVLKMQLGKITQAEAVTACQVDFSAASHSVSLLIGSLCLYWVDKDGAKKKLPTILLALCDRSQSCGYGWIASEAAEILARLDPKYQERAEQLRAELGLKTVVDAIHTQESWELCLTALSNFGRVEPTVATDRRLVWLLTMYGSNSYYLEPREQKIGAKGDWSKGRPIALKRLLNPSSFGYFSPQDIRVCNEIESEYQYSRYGGEMEYKFSENAIAELIGHPLVFWEDTPQVSIEIMGGEPALVVQKTEQGINIQLVPPMRQDLGIVIVKETPTKVRVTKVTAEYRKIAALIGDRLQVPAEAQERVLAAISNIAQIVTVHSDIGGGASNARCVEASPQPHLHLLPINGGGLKVSLLVRPFETGGPYFQPGHGSEIVIAEVAGERLQTNRLLEKEQSLAQAILKACSTLENWESTDSEWLISDPESCLELLLELQTLEDLAVIEWPEGEKLRIKQRADISNFSMQINRNQNWFEANGELQLDGDQVLNMRQLMDLLSTTSGRFIPLGDGEFLALTENFRKQLDELRAFSHKQGDGVRFHPLAGAVMQDLFEEVGQLKTDKHWKAQVKKLKELPDFHPKLPSTLQAELRDYQVEGFRWLSQLAHWGVGACLADDMGLGKTVQTLAAILNRAMDGPTLILAPTSVCTNWIGEAEKFAPTLNLLQLGTGDRQETLDRLQPFDLLICSYGLLQQEDVGKMLAEVEWETIVLDEAQAIKNAATKRSQAAMRLKGKFKVLTTGTPIENHLGELWNLFQFTNPGLLGSLDDFNQKFANPIERQQEPMARLRLKQLIQPFILRRTKSQVLAELPSRTEIVLHVELSREEQLFYEALRQEALEKLSDSQANAGQKHLQVLAEIMRLRRACCNPKLVKPQLNLVSSKLELFGETLEELLDNGHKALVFSQFVDHLTIVREYLDRQNISYQYLDGSTPAKERKRRVDAFQAGEGDVFLISLKAGGTGLNLTAADYVIHMDPWWNPAVEDQASDRAHRIGQQRPVTIYRLVAKDTIEDKIVALHQHKRDLANSLLEGTEMSGKVSTEQLLQLIRGD
jgi:SNF2 family DNA or RNA helicase